jgi:hypothetical protein
MLVFAALRQPWWQEPQFTQAWRRPPPSCCQSRETSAAGASAVRTPSAAHPRAIMSAEALRFAGGNG